QAFRSAKQSLQSACADADAAGDPIDAKRLVKVVSDEVGRALKLDAVVPRQKQGLVLFRIRLQGGCKTFRHDFHRPPFEKEIVKLGGKGRRLEDLPEQVDRARRKDPVMLGQMVVEEPLPPGAAAKVLH